jgi:hypothetical protein
MSSKSRLTVLACAALLGAGALSGAHASHVVPSGSVARLFTAVAAVPAGQMQAPQWAGVHVIHPVCLIGSWNLLDIDTYKQTLFATSHIHILDVSGTMHLRFDDDGQLRESTDGITVTAQAGSDTMVETMTGSLIASYDEQPSGTLNVGGLSGSFQVSATLNGTPFLDNVDVSDLLLGSDGSSISYSCDCDRMSLEPHLPQAPSKPRRKVLIYPGHRTPGCPKPSAGTTQDRPFAQCWEKGGEG